jgi:4-amino-4-deoxy-L-arabinose transferase-like glycosyltransferase
MLHASARINKWNWCLGIAGAAIAANAMILLTDATPLQLLGGGVLFAFLPGLMAIELLFPQEASPKMLEGVLLSIGTSYFLSTLVVLIIHFLPGPISLLSLLLGLDLLLALLLVLCLAHQRDLSWLTFNLPDRRSLALIALVLLLAFFYRFATLGYSEYQGDDIDVTSLARAAIMGQDDAFFWHKKGPVELAAAVAFALFTNGFTEFALRFPFALASTLAVLTAFLAASHMFNQRVAALAGLLLVIEGITLSRSRAVQYQGVVILALTLAFYCFYRLNQIDESRLADRYQVLGTGFFAFGLLTHYTAALMGVPLLFLYWQRYGRRFLKDNGRILLLSSGLAAIILAAYYVPFVLHPHFAQTFEGYTTIRISPERGPYNNLPAYFTLNIFYNSIYYVVTMTVFLIVACVESVWRGLRPKSLATAILLLFVPGLIGSILFPSLLTLGGVKYSILLFLPLFIALWLGKGMSVGRRAVFLWFFSYLIFYAFIIRVPGVHYYCLSPAWAIIAALGLERVYLLVGEGNPPLPPLYRRAVIVVFALVYVLFAYYTYILFVRTDPEYALSYPQHRIPLYWNTHQGPPLQFFGLPHKSGWKTIGCLYRDGTLQGDYRTNEKSEISDWYIGQEPSQVERPRYYFIAENPTEKEYKQDYPRELLQSEYQEIGTVTVGGKPRLHIYELKALSAQGQVTRYESETYEPLYNRAFALPK